jgi:hypothetical protein
MMTWFNGVVRIRLLSLVLALVTTSFLLFLLFPVTQHPATRWLTPVAYAQGGALAPIKNLLKRTGLYTPPRKGTPPTGRRVGGAGRGPICALPENEPNDQVKALVPSESVNDENTSETQETGIATNAEAVGGLTITPRPTFWFYVPYVSTVNSTSGASSKRVAQFVLLDETNHPVWNELINIELRDRPRLIEYPLPYTLETEKLYSWYFSVICDSDKLSRNPIVRGWVERTEPTPELKIALRTAPRYEQYVVYANNGIWFETVSSLVDVRRQFPYTNRDDWTILLAHFGIPAANQLDVLEPVVPVEREVVNGNQLPART